MKTRQIVLVGLLLLSIAACRNREVAPSVPPDVQAIQRRTFESLWMTVNDFYVYEDFGGVDWQAVYDDYQSQLEPEMTAEAFDALLEEMLTQLPAEGIGLQTRAERLETAVNGLDRANYEGIGAFVSIRREEEPRIILLSVMTDSPAEEAGLQAHDAILAIDGEPIDPEEENPISRVRGPAGSSVTLTVRSPESEARDVVVTRGRITSTTTPVRWEMLAENGIGYFWFPPNDYEGLVEDTVTGMEALTSESGLQGIILDFRAAAVDELWSGRAFLTLFTDGDVGELYSRSESLVVTIDGIFDLNTHDLPVAILVGPGTTGPAEVFAAILQALDRGTIVGLPTRGNLETGSVFNLPNGSLLSLATGSFRTLDGREVGLLGVEPDVIVDADWDAVTAEDDPVLAAAQEVLLSRP
jgi:C-terminal peptidase prc